MKIYLSENELTELGRITAAFSSLEAVVAAGIQMVIGSDLTIGKIVTAKLSFKRSAEILSAFMRHIIGDEGEFNEFQDRIKEALKAEEKRNRIIHSDWWPGDDLGTIRIKSVVRLKKGMTSQVERITDEDLRSIADEIGIARDGLAQILEKFALNGKLPGIKRSDNHG